VVVLLHHVLIILFEVFDELGAWIRLFQQILNLGHLLIILGLFNLLEVAVEHLFEHWVVTADLLRLLHRLNILSQFLGGRLVKMVLNDLVGQLHEHVVKHDFAHLLVGWDTEVTNELGSISGVGRDPLPLIDRYQV